MTKNKFAVLGISLLAGLLITGSITGALALNGPSTANAAPQTTAALVNTTVAAQQDTNAATQTPEATEAAAPQDTGVAAEAAETTDAEENASAEQNNETQDTASEATEDTALAAKATITAAQAEDAVNAAYPGCKIAGAKLGDENGTVIYEVSITDKSGKALDVKVDASNAKVISADSGADDQQEASGQDTDTDNVEQEGEH